MAAEGLFNDARRCVNRTCATRSIRRAQLLALGVVGVMLWTPEVAAAHPPTGHQTRLADSPASTAPARTGPNRAPSGPPLTRPAESSAGSGDEAGSTGDAPGEADPLVSNGLGSPLCDGALSGGELSARSRRDCQTSGLVAAVAPTGDYGIDVHIDTGVLGLSSGGLLSAVQDLFVTPLWMALVWAVHALVVLLEWCFTIDLLDSSSLGGLGAGLRQMQAAFTAPWLAASLAVASVLALYNGLIRQRVAQTLGEVVLALAMMAGGTWVILDPVGTVGALGGWANQAGLGTLAVTTEGTAAGPGRALGDGMGTVFAAAIEVPWCYLEFGDVGWCRNPARLDARLHAAALRIAAAELAMASCKPDPAGLLQCAAPGSEQAKALQVSAGLLRDASSNGAVFLALPANGPARNSINEESSLLRVLCQSDEATRCRGPTAAQAEFRTNRGTWSRVGGLLLIVAGVLGMLLLLGFIALRLLAAALFSLLYLLLAPAAVLAPAFGEGGRAVFRKWATQLLGAVISKLLFSFLLGVVLAIVTLLGGLEALGWWTQWLLMSAFWWGAYARRHQALGIAGVALSDRRSAGEESKRSRSVVQRMRGALEPPRRIIGAARLAKDKLVRPNQTLEYRQKRASAGRRRARAGTEAQVARLLEHQQREAKVFAASSPAVQGQLSAWRAQLVRVQSERRRALVSGDKRRAAVLAHRGQRIEGDIAREQHNLNSARQLAGAATGALSGTAAGYSGGRAGEGDRFLDAQAELPPSVRARESATAERRDYAGLAGLAGLGRQEYQRLDPRSQRLARLEVDRELALRKELRATASDLAASVEDWPLKRRESIKAERAFDGALKQRMQDRGLSMPPAQVESWLESWRGDGRADQRAADARESSVMRDAQAVATRRKRQLGRDRP
jgi:hypothetical protein